MDKVITNDGSLTYYNDKFSEHYHSISGAKEEALKKFILPSLKYLNFGEKNIIRILDVCFGLGYNTSAAIDEIKKRFNIKIEIIALENDINILNNILDNNVDFESYDLIKKCVNNNYFYEDDNLSIKIILGDGIENINKIKGNFDLIFHDPFSKTKMPDFWTEDFFKKEFNLLNKGGILTTYSCARNVRDNLKKVNFKIHDVEPVGRRAPSTLAIKPL